MIRSRLSTARPRALRGRQGPVPYEDLNEDLNDDRSLISDNLIVISA